MMMRWLTRGAIAGGLVLSLSGCGGGGGSSSSATTPPSTVTTAQEDKFGPVFGNDFRASPNSEPAPVKDGDIVAVSLTTEPIAIQ